MTLSAELFTIRLPHPFRIAYGTSDTRDTILVHLHDEETGLTGHGEGALPPYYPSKAGACLEWLRQPSLDDLGVPPSNAAAAAVALEIARQDLAAQKSGSPLWQIWGLNAGVLPPCARTISIPLTERELRERLEEGLNYGSTYFKLKLGGGDLEWDQKCVAIIRDDFPQIKLAVDANAAWSPEEAAKLLPIFGRMGIEFVEQPVGREWEYWRALRSRLRTTKIPPLVADESLQTESDIELARQWADGVNVKLLKAGGLDPARRWITAARALNLRVMIGVMVETGVGRTAAAQLAPLADWLDIDPADTIPFTPLVGIAIEGDRLALSSAPGLGLQSIA